MTAGEPTTGAASVSLSELDFPPEPAARGAAPDSLENGTTVGYSESGRVCSLWPCSASASAGSVAGKSCFSPTASSGMALAPASAPSAATLAPWMNSGERLPCSSASAPASAASKSSAESSAESRISDASAWMRMLPPAAVPFAFGSSPASSPTQTYSGASSSRGPGLESSLTSSRCLSCKSATAATCLTALSSAWLRSSSPLDTSSRDVAMTAL
mmetsp:Transcript_35083/g.83229  ORF Transcript_35083/g.83229 Transcript_35083/m.83229 type:complete len:215 (-) Transcript_35083:140-784(-)